MLNMHGVAQLLILLRLSVLAHLGLADPEFLGTEEDETLDSSPYLWVIETGPEGMTIDPTSGLIQWTPTENQVGSQYQFFKT